MSRSRTWVKKVPVVFIGAVWCGVLLYLCIWCPMTFTGDSEALDSIRILGKGWMVLSGIAFAYLLFWSSSSLRPFRMRGGRIRVGALRNTLSERKSMFKGLVGGLLCSLPALAITLVGLVVSVPHPEGWVTSDLSSLASNNLQEGIAIPPVPDSRRAYLIGIDLSWSSLRNTQDSRLGQICKAVNALLLRERNGAFPELIKSEDIVSFYVFAENQKPLYISGSALEKPSNSQMAEQVCKDLQVLVDQLVNESDDIGRGRTDILKFLEDMLGKVQSLPDDPWGTIIVFSDFRQDNDFQSSRDLNDRISALMSEIGTRGKLVGFLMPTLNDSVERQGKDITPFLRQHGWDQSGEIGFWKEIPLDAMDSADIVPQKELLRHVYREVRPPGGLHLKYKVFPFWTGTPTHVDLPGLPGYGRVLVALRPPEAGGDAMPEVSVGVGDSMLVKMGDIAEYELNAGSSSSPSRLPIKLVRAGDISRTKELDLLIVSPRRSMTHTVRLVVLPTIGSLPLEMLRWALALAAITFVLLVIGASGADLWLRRKALWLFRKWGLRKRRVPAYSGLGKGGIP